MDLVGIGMAILVEVQLVDVYSTMISNRYTELSCMVERS